MIEKAQENLKAAGLLIEEDCPNAAASRTYYAAYHACWWALAQQGVLPDKRRRGRTYWSHDSIAETMCIQGPAEFDAELRDEFNDILLAERIVADYDEEEVAEPDVRECIALAEKILISIKAAPNE